MTEKQTYSSRVTCGNCGLEAKIDIPKGQLVTTTPCPRCGCITLRHRPQNPVWS